MPKLADYPIGLQPYIYNGADVDIKGDEAVGDCPFCGGEAKFSINIQRGVWKCWRCNEGSNNGGGNIYTFFAKLYEMGRNKNVPRIQELAKEKGIISVETLLDWGVFVHPLTDDLALVGYNRDGKIVNIYRWLEDYDNEGKMRWMPTKRDKTNEEHNQLSPTLLGCHLFDPSKENIFLVEGFFDAVALYETLGFTKKVVSEDEEETYDLNFTLDVYESYLQDYNILAIPSAMIFSEKWVEYFSDKNVYLLPHNDYPKKNILTGSVSEPAGYRGMKKVAGEISSADNPPKKIQYLSWHPAGESYDPARKSGYDIRDLLNEGVTKGDIYEKRITNFAEMITLCREIPASWGKIENNTLQMEGMRAETCENWEELVNFWKVALHFTEGLNRALSVMLACVASTNMKGDQLWVKIISAPGTAKTVLCRALGVSKQYVLEGSIITGFHSGWRGKNQEGEKTDFSLINKMQGKTFVMKDGDTLLRTPNLMQILAQLRDIYDGETSSHYRSQDTKDHKGLRSTIIICGTDSLRELDSSELGERFIDCILMRSLPADLERDILRSAFFAADRDTREMVNGKLEGHFSLDMGKAMRLTAGYVGYLRRNVEDLIHDVTYSEETREECLDLAQFTAFMRARPSKKQDERKSKELGTRLSKQLWRLALCLAVVLNKKEIDTEVMRRVRQCALDTCEGKTLELAGYLYRAGIKGDTANNLAYKANHDKTKIYSYLLFLRGIEVVEPFYPVRNGVKEDMRWRLLPNVSNLYKKIMNK